MAPLPPAGNTDEAHSLQVFKAASPLRGESALRRLRTLTLSRASHTLCEIQGLNPKAQRRVASSLWQQSRQRQPTASKLIELKPGGPRRRVPVKLSD